MGAVASLPDAIVKAVVAAGLGAFGLRVSRLPRRCSLAMEASLCMDGEQPLREQNRRSVIYEMIRVVSARSAGLTTLVRIDALIFRDKA